jgi:multidrug resistance efflux pump
MVQRLVADSASARNPRVSESSLPPVAGAAADSAQGRLRSRVRSLQLPPMPERRWLTLPRLGLLALTLLLSAGGWMWWTSQNSGQRRAPADRAAADAGPAVAVSAAKPVVDQEPSAGPPFAAAASPPAARGQIALESKGYVIPTHRILVSPKVPGMLMKLNVEEGERVQKGDVLGQIESVEYEADLQRALATLKLAQERLRELEAGGRFEEIKRGEAELLEATETMRGIEADYKRITQLQQSGSVTQAEYDSISSNYQAQKARIDRLTFALRLLEKPAREEVIAQAQAEVAQADADVVKARWRLDNCTIRSPISGTILKKNAEEGNIVNPIAFNGSFSVCEAADLSDLEIDLNIQERDVAKVFPGQRCTVRAEAYPDRVYEGQVSRLMPIADRAKGAIPVRVKVTVPPAEEGMYLKPDMGAIVTFYEQEPSASAN